MEEEKELFTAKGSKSGETRRRPRSFLPIPPWRIDESPELMRGDRGSWQTG